MATTFSSTTLDEKGSGIIQCVFTDEDGDAVVPNAGTIKWTLTNRPVHDTTPTIINSREQQDITSASTVNIPVSGNDLAMLAGEVDDAFVERVMLVEYVYNSTVASDLPGKGQHIFRVNNLHYPT